MVSPGDTSAPQGKTLRHQDKAGLGPTVRLSGHGHCAILRLEQRLSVFIPRFGSGGSDVGCQGSEFEASMAVNWAVSRGGFWGSHILKSQGRGASAPQTHGWRADYNKLLLGLKSSEEPTDIAHQAACSGK